MVLVAMSLSCGMTLTCDLVLEFEPPPGVLGIRAEGHADLLAERVELVLRRQVRAARLHGLVEQSLSEKLQGTSKRLFPGCENVG